MHLSVKHAPSLEENNAPVNPEQSPADLVMLSFTDSDLACMAAAYNSLPRRGEESLTLRLTSLATLKHPLSVDLYLEQVASHAKAILVRLLGGCDWWRYGVEELSRLARQKHIALVMVPGDQCDDPRLTELSTVNADLVNGIAACLAQGGVDNSARVLDCLQLLAAGQTPVAPEPLMIPPGACYRQSYPVGCEAAAQNNHNAIILFYRAHSLAADTAPIDALLEALAAQGLAARAFMVTSLKDPQALDALREDCVAHRPDIILDATAFSAGQESHPLAELNVPVLQVALANTPLAAWQSARRGLSTTDTAMHIVLPEADGRIFTRAISFKAEIAMDSATEWKRIIHQPEASRIRYVAGLAAAWVRLGKKATKDRRLALVLSDYPGRAGRCAYAVGLDAPQSVTHMLQLLEDHGYSTSLRGAEGDVVIQVAGLLRGACDDETYPLSDYLARFDALPENQRQALTKAWGTPQDDPFFNQDAFRLPCLRLGHIIVALQPDRGSTLDRKAGYHDALMPPRHGYLAFYWWLRDVAKIDGMIHLGTHGNLEWLPGKAVALSENCWPEIVLGPLPMVYPYIVSDPGEAAQAKRRICAVTLSHMTPPLLPVALSPKLAELEMLVDEFSAASGLDARRMALLREDILHRARRAGLPGQDDDALLTALEAHLCDIKEQRVGDGLHVFGTAGLEAQNLLAALGGKFIPPGPGGSPVRGRADILPTGRNITTIDPRSIPTRTAAAIGQRAACEFVRRYVQDHGDWPEHVVMDVWGSATLRNGGDEIAQALYLMGANPVWDDATSRVTGFEILPAAGTEWPCIDVSLRISGLFRDMFPHLIALFDDAATAVAKQEGWATAWRIFGSAPGAYGAGVVPLTDAGRWSQRGELGQAYLDASHFAYGRHAEGVAKPEALQQCLMQADALIHVQDQRETDVLSGADFADAEGGFAAAAALLGNDPALYHLDTSQPQRIKARTLAEEIALTLHARALNPQWIAGQMRHGYAGAAALTDVVDQLFAFAATTDSVPQAQFEAAFDAYLHNDAVRDFLARENPAALAAMAARFDEAIRRHLWNPLRNSTGALLDSLTGHREAA